MERDGVVTTVHGKTDMNIAPSVRESVCLFDWVRFVMCLFDWKGLIKQNARSSAPCGVPFTAVDQNRVRHR